MCVILYYILSIIFTRGVYCMVCILLLVVYTTYVVYERTVSDVNTMNTTYCA